MHGWARRGLGNTTRAGHPRMVSGVPPFVVAQYSSPERYESRRCFPDGWRESSRRVFPLVSRLVFPLVFPVGFSRHWPR